MTVDSLGPHGYDPYAYEGARGAAETLERGPFDYIVSHNVLEHVEAPCELLREMDAHLAAGGHMPVGTLNADNLDLARPEESWNEVHAPYHLHIYTRAAVEGMGRRLGWTPVGFFERPYHDCAWPGLSTHAAKVYQRWLEGTLDAVLEPVRPWKGLTSPRYWFYALFGYWLSFRSDIAIMFEKPG